MYQGKNERTPGIPPNFPHQNFDIDDTYTRGLALQTVYAIERLLSGFNVHPNFV